MDKLIDNVTGDNVLQNSAALSDEYEVVRKTVKKCNLYDGTRKTISGNKGPTNKNVVSGYFQKTSSGVSSEVSSMFDDYEIETDSSVQTTLGSSVNKRLIEFNLPTLRESKKIKIDDTVLIDNQKSGTEDCEEVLHGTLDSVNVTNLLEKEKANSGEKGGFDAFANYLSDVCILKSAGNRKNVLNEDAGACSTSKSDEDIVFSSQFPNTQALIEIVKLEKIKISNKNCLNASETSSGKNCTSNKNETEVNKEKCKISTKQESAGAATNAPLRLCFKERLKSKDFIKETSIDREIAERSVLFENENVTTEYRKEVDHMFEQIESSICAMGEDNVNINIPEELLDIIFNDDLEMSPDRKEGKEETDSNSQVNSTNANLSFGTIIKKALIKNSTKVPAERKRPVQPLNLTVKETNVTFRSLGPFYGLPLKVKNLVKQYKGIEELYDWQDECLKLPAIENKKNLIYALPTSGGKTLVAEILMFRELLCYKRNAIFILPYVSIVQEKVWAISPFGVALDFLVEEYASNKGVYPPRKRRRKNSIYVATIEKSLGIINSLIEMGRLHEIGLIVVDEFHLIGEDGRGPTLEAALTKIMFLKANIQIIGMSATIGNMSDLCKFLDADVYTKNFRPIELVEYVKCANNIAKINWSYQDEEDLLVDHKKVDYKYSESILKLDPDMVGGLVMEVIPEGSCLVFCPSKKNCENVANLLCKLCKPELKNYKQSEKEQLIHALKDEGGKLCDILAVSIQYGIAYHHSGLTSDERRIIEEGFRAGIIYVICCTSTLAAGVNLPAKRVILRSPYIGKDFINLSRYKQMVGRAGRTGLGETGESILIAQPQDLPKVVELMMSPMNKALSGMHVLDGKGLRHLLLSCISLAVANTRVQLQEVTAHTLLAVQSTQLEVDIKNVTDKVIKNLFKLGALKESSTEAKEKETSKDMYNVSVRMDTSIPDTPLSENVATPSRKRKKTIVLTDNTKLVVSDLGCAAIKGGLELSRAHMLYEDLYEAQSCLVLKGHLHLLYLVTPYETADQIKPNKQIYYEVFTRLKPSELRVAKTLGLNESVAVKMLSNNIVKTVPERVINRFYLTLMLYDLWNEMPVFEVSEKYQINRGIVQNLMTSTATFTSNVVNFCEELEEFWAYSYLLKGMSQRLSHCCVKELVSLMELPAVKQSRAKQLYNAGFKTLQSIAKANVNDLVEKIEFMSERVASQLIAASKMLLLERVENLREEAEDVLDGVEVPK